MNEPNLDQTSNWNKTCTINNVFFFHTQNGRDQLRILFE